MDLVDRITLMWTDLAGRLRAIWEVQNRTARMVTIGLIAVVVIGIAALSTLYIGHKPSYDVLFAGLSADDAVAVTQRLKDDKIDYHTQQVGNSTTIYVPSSVVAEERVQVAGSGILKNGGTGYELFDKTNFGMTEFQEKIAKTRATEGELQRTINNLDPVEAARVHIAAPDTGLYSSTQQPTTASIAIKTKSGQSLSPQEVRGITMLVANAVAGLKPENVTIVNQDGTVLVPSATTADSADGSTGATALKMTQDQLLAKQRYESNLQENIQSMLDDTLGKKKAVARVSTKMNFDANSSETKTFAPQGTILSQQSKHESYVGTQPNRQIPAGVPGTTSNIGTYQAIQPNQTAAGRYNKSENTTNYNISEQNSKHIDAPGKVLSTSVAVLVDVPSTTATTTTTSGPAAVTTASQVARYNLTPANVSQIRNTVIAAAGLNLAAGDQVSVEAVPFNPAVTGEVTTVQAPGTILGIPVWAWFLLGIAGVGLLGFLVARRRQAGFRPAGAELPSFDATLAEELPPFEEHPMLDGAPGIAAPIRSAADLTREQMIEYVTTVAQENPDSIAKLVKLWLAE
ncbi:MAG: flagellar M-ring protein FliF [Candidatus Eremiobacteraeota bacterium]|nr:flagellar M-ring protein FliF [Candidatus Eremiobacteraeota bacterium]